MQAKRKQHVGTNDRAAAEMCNCRVAAFDDRSEAIRAVADLHESGFTPENVGFALRGDDVGAGGMITDAPAAGSGMGAAKGAAVGGVLGAILGAVATVAIPGLGPVLFGGILATALGFGAGGVVTGGILGAMRAMGATEEEAHWFARAFDAGKALVAIAPGTPHAERAMTILQEHGGVCAHRLPAARKHPHEFRHNVY